jgi:hypothetical protein
LDIPPIGWILIPLGLVCVLFARRSLYSLTIFFVPFSATAVINVGAKDNASGLQATIFLGSLWMMTEIFTFFRDKRSSVRENLAKPVKYLGWFTGIAALSLMMPVWINGRVFIEEGEYSNGFGNAEPLVFTARHVTQFVYLIYGVMFAILVAYKNSDIRQFVKTIRIFLYSAIFVSFWGFVQFACSLFHVEYPAFIFNTSTTKSALGYLEELEDIGIARVSSVATEPSIFAGCMLIAFVFAFFAVSRRRPVISYIWDRVALAIILGGLLISTSTIAYIGIVAVFIIYWFTRPKRGLFKAKHAWTLLLVVATIGLIFTFLPPAQEIIDAFVISKTESYSGIARAYTIALAAQYFLQYPILGLGWGSVTSHDLVVKLLANVGIVGFVVFCIFLASLFSRLWRGRAYGVAADSEWPWWGRCLLVAYLTVVFTSLTTGFDYVYSHIWLVFGLAMAIPPTSSTLTLAQPALPKDRNEEVLVR